MGVGGTSSGGNDAGGTGGSPVLDASNDVGAEEAVSIDATDARSEGLADAASDVALDSSCVDPPCILRATLAHRYSFDGTGTVAIDSVGKADGTLVNVQLTGNGKLVLAGVATDEFVDLPNGIIRSLTNATFETWVTWSGGAGWQRLFDFGSSNMAEGTRGVASSSLYLTPQGGGPTVMLAAFKRQDQTAANETRALAAQGLVASTPVHLALVIDATNGLMTLYRDGAMEVSTPFHDPLSALSDVNNWLGRSQYVSNDSFGGTIDEFRIYAAALSQAQVQASFAAGPNPPFLN